MRLPQLPHKTVKSRMADVDVLRMPRSLGTITRHISENLYYENARHLPWHFRPYY